MQTIYISSIKKLINSAIGIAGFILLQLSYISCRKSAEVPPPVTNPISSTVYQSNATAAAALSGIYSRMIESHGKFSTGTTGLSLLGGLSSDELKSNVTSTPFAQFYKNQLVSDGLPTTLWAEPYQNIYTANGAIEGLTGSTGVSTAVKQQLLGEAKFIRAFFYFYLVNLYGDVPLIKTTDYRLNQFASRTLADTINQQIKTDLTEAQSLLSSNFLKADAVGTTTERVRPTKWAATAMLARLKLYRQDWAGAEAEATTVINNSSLFDTVSLSAGVFNKNTKEAIWQLQPVAPGYNTHDGSMFILASAPSSSQPVGLSDQLLTAFEPNDLRKTNWVGTYTIHSFPYKYKVGGGTNTSVTEYLMVLRLAEQYLIRAEARAQQNKIVEAQADLNVIRKRARLPETTANDKASLLPAILKERQVELFSEWGHRWLDLKRTGTVDAVMSVVTSQKGGTWNSNWKWYPIPSSDILRNPNLTQNNGY